DSRVQTRRSRNPTTHVARPRRGWCPGRWSPGHRQTLLCDLDTEVHAIDHDLLVARVAEAHHLALIVEGIVDVVARTADVVGKGACVAKLEGNRVGHVVGEVGPQFGHGGEGILATSVGETLRPGVERMVSPPRQEVFADEADLFPVLNVVAEHESALGVEYPATLVA